MTNATPIRSLMDLRHVAHERNEAVELASKTSDYLGAEWAPSSRIWSRQAEALTIAVVSEAPQDLEDVLSVLCCLAQIRDDRNGIGVEPTQEQREAQEMTDVALHNCIVALAGNITREGLYPETEIRDLHWSSAHVAQWIPKPFARWAELAKERARLDAAEDAAAEAGNDKEADAHQQLRYAAEEELMAMPAPNGAGLALKVLIAIGQDRASIPYQEAVEADARRLAGMEARS